MAETTAQHQQAAGSIVSLPTAALDSLASRMRQSGLFMFVLRTDGSVAYWDPTPAPFFQKYAISIFQQAPVSATLADAAKSMNTASSVQSIAALPGLVVAACPFAEKRNVQGVFFLAAKSYTFRLSEEVLRVCSQSETDSQWLAQQAESLPSYGDEALLRQARMLQGMLKDQIRVSGLERELESLSGQLSNTYEELSLIYQLSSGMKINRSASDFFKQACLDVMGVMDVRSMGFVLRGDGALNQPPAVYGEAELPKDNVNLLADQLMTAFARNPGTLLVNHIEKETQFACLAGHAKQLLAVPLIRGKQVLGCLFAIDKAQDEFSSADAKLLTSISNESAVYLENAMLYEDVHGLMMGLLHSLTSAVDAKDAYTCGHSERVALLSRHLALATGLSEAEADRFYMAGLLHDVGKIGVPEAVLQKTGRLTNEEFELIKKHPEIGARILRDIKQIEDLIPGVMHHHERYDGKGYPLGLSGDEIPLMGRIICLADCFDAMTSSRTYRKGLPIEVAMMEIRRCAGTQFDPTLADAFLQISSEELRDLLKNHSASLRRVLDMQQAMRAA